MCLREGKESREKEDVGMKDNTKEYERRRGWRRVAFVTVKGRRAGTKRKTRIGGGGRQVRRMKNRRKRAKCRLILYRERGNESTHSQLMDRVVAALERHKQQAGVEGNRGGGKWRPRKPSPYTTLSVVSVPNDESQRERNSKKKRQTGC